MLSCQVSIEDNKIFINGKIISLSGGYEHALCVSVPEDKICFMSLEEAIEYCLKE